MGAIRREHLTNGLPNAEMGRISTGALTSKPTSHLRRRHRPLGITARVYRSMMVERLVSDEAGKRHQRLLICGGLVGFFPHPADPDRFCRASTYIAPPMASKFWNGIASFIRRPSRSLHHYNHPDYMVLGNDGGLYISKIMPTTWQQKNHCPSLQFYTCGVNGQQPAGATAALQDNGTVSPPPVTSATGNSSSSGTALLPGRSNPDNHFINAGIQSGTLRRSINRGLPFLNTYRVIPDEEQPAIELKDYAWVGFNLAEKIPRSLLRRFPVCAGQPTGIASSGSFISETPLRYGRSGNLIYGTITTIAVSSSGPPITS